MYDTVCERCKCDPSIGINWNTAKSIFMQANNNTTHPPPTKRLSTASNSISCSDSLHSIASNDTESHSSQQQQQQQIIRRLSYIHRRPSKINMNNSSISFESNNSDASAMIVDMLETKNKNLSQQLIKERTKRKKTEEIAQSLLTQNDEYKQQISHIQQTNHQLNVENKALNTELNKLRRCNQESSQTIAHLHQQRNGLRAERDDSYHLLTRIEQEHVLLVKKLKVKHKSDMAALKESERQHTNALKHTVDNLKRSLARKQQSLVEALQAVDNIACSDQQRVDEFEQYKLQADDKKRKRRQSSRIKTKLKAWNQRRKSATPRPRLPRVRKMSDSFVGLKRLQQRSKRSDSLSSSEFIGVSELQINEIPVISKQPYLKRLSENFEENDLESMQLMSDKFIISETLEQSPSIEHLEKTDCLVHAQMEKMKHQMEQMQNTRNSLLSEKAEYPLEYPRSSTVSKEEFIGY